jgi:hypothetical protein
MLEHWLNPPLDHDSYTVFAAEEYNVEHYESMNGQGAQEDNGAGSVSEEELSIGEEEHEVSVMLGRWLDEPLSDGPFMAYGYEEHSVGDSG